MAQEEAPTQVVSHLALRKLIGLLGMLLPWACWAANALVNGLDLLNNDQLAILGTSEQYVPLCNLKESISHFYYTASAPLFIGIIVSVALFLFCYKGYDFNKERDYSSFLSDRVVCTVAAVAALGIVIFPTGEDQFIKDSLFIYTVTKSVGYVHYAFAALFFICIAVLCLVNFRRQESKADFGKGEFDLLYKICGWLIIGSISVIFIYGVFFKDRWALDLPVTFLLEAVALTAFGVAWLVKGKVQELTLAELLGKKSQRK